MHRRVVIRANPARLRTISSFAFSGLIHASLLFWLVVAAAIHSEPAAKSIYEQEIRPYEKHIVWYNLRNKLPDVKSSSAPSDRRPPRARFKFNQSIVAGKSDDARPAQRILAPAPEIELSKALPLPNVLAVTSRPVREFTPPPAPPRPSAAAALLPDAPTLNTETRPAVAGLSASAARPSRPFEPPAPSTHSLTMPVLPDAPELSAKIPAAQIELPVGSRPVRTFTAPAGPARPAPSRIVLPDAPELASRLSPTPPKLDLGTTSRPLRAFAPPSEPRRAASTPLPALPEAPQVSVAAPQGASPAAAPITGPRRAFSIPPDRARRQMGESADLAAPEIGSLASAAAPAPHIPRSFAAPPAAPRRTSSPSRNGIDAPPPALNATGPATAPNATLAIVGLNPINAADIPAPPGSHDAAFSAGVKPNPTGGDAQASRASVTIPGLSASGGSDDDRPTLVSVLGPPTSRQNLAAALHASFPRTSDSIPDPAPAARSLAPDPRFAGRHVYTLAIQMPNITSYSGSWIVWFAERDPAASGDLRPPLATRKVDPKYIPAAADEKVEGTVRLAAVIRKTGRVDSVELLRHLDARLDRSAAEALVKWEFQPAKRNGEPVDIDAVFEIPFRLAPAPKR